MIIMVGTITIRIIPIGTSIQEGQCIGVIASVGVIPAGDLDTPMDIPIMEATVDIMIRFTQTGAGAEITMVDTMVDITPTTGAHTGADIMTIATMVQATTITEGLTTGTPMDTQGHPMQPMEAQRVPPMLTPNTGVARYQAHQTEEFPVPLLRQELPSQLRSHVPTPREPILQIPRGPIVATIMGMIVRITTPGTREMLTGTRIQATGPLLLVR